MINPNAEDFAVSLLRQALFAAFQPLKAIHYLKEALDTVTFAGYVQENGAYKAVSEYILYLKDPGASPKPYWMTSAGI